MLKKFRPQWDNLDGSILPDNHSGSLPDFLPLRPAPGSRKGALLIICLGDSHTYGQGVNAAQAYPHRLEWILNSHRHNRRVQVINAGSPGICMIEKRRLYEIKYAAYGPALVIVQTGNDLPRIAAHVIENRGAMGWRWRLTRWIYDKFPGSVLAQRAWSKTVAATEQEIKNFMLSPRGRRLLAVSQAVYSDNLRRLDSDIARMGGRMMIVEYDMGDAVRGDFHHAINKAIVDAGLSLKPPVCVINERNLDDCHLPDGHLNSKGYQRFVSDLIGGECGRDMKRFFGPR